MAWLLEIRTKLAKKSRWIVILLLLVLGIVGFGLLMWVTPYGVGVYVDTLYYVTSARNLLAGEGMGRFTGTGVFKPMTHYPPLYALALALTQLLGLDILYGARWISLLAFGAVIFMAGWLVWQRTGSAIFSLVAAGLVLGSGVMLKTFSWAMSEPLYIVLELLGFLLLGLYFKTSSAPRLLAATLIFSLALLTRYVGFSLVGAMSLVLLANRSLPWRRRLWDAGIFLPISLLPTAAWFLRNRLVAGTLANRVITWHPVPEEKAASLVKAVLSWGLVPQRLVVGHETLAFLAIVSGLVLISLVWLARSYPKPNQAPSQEFILLLNSWVYAGLLTISITWIDATTPLDNRILMPVYLNILLLVGIGLGGLWMRRGWLPRLVAAGMIFWLGYYMVTRLDGTVLYLRSDGQDYASLKWKNSPTIEFVKAQHPALIYTNDVTAIYFLAEQDAVGIPNFQSNAEEFNAMRENLRATGGFLVLFGALTGEFASLEKLIQGMVLIGKFDDGMVYKFPP